MADKVELIRLGEGSDFDYVAQVQQYDSDDVLKYWRYYRLMEALPKERMQTPNKLLLAATNLLELTPFVEAHRPDYDTIWKKQFDRLFNDQDKMTLLVYTNCLGQRCRIIQRSGRAISHGHEGKNFSEFLPTVFVKTGPEITQLVFDHLLKCYQCTDKLLLFALKPGTIFQGKLMRLVA